jgi:hypothetical protein
MRVAFFSIILSISLIGCLRATDPKIAAVRTDSILHSLRRATHYIDSARNLLVSLDPGGDSPHVASGLLIHTSLGDSLRSSAQALITCCHDNWPNPATIINMDKAFHFTKQLVAPDAWNHLYFSGTPTSAAYTVLSSMEDECKSAANLTMTSIDGRRR